MPAELLSPSRPLLPAGAVLLRRGERPTHILHLRSGRIILGLLERGVMQHQLGVLEGPFWVEASSAVLGLPHAVDAVAESDVQLAEVSVQSLQAHLSALPEPSRTLLADLARTQRQQAEVAISRLAKDADARCAEWLLKHAQADKVTHHLCVTFCQRKRLIAAQLGIAPETFSRALRHLKDRQLVGGTGRVLELHNPEGLRQLVGA